MRRKDMTRINLPVNRFVDDDVTTKEFVKSRTLPLLYVPETLYPCLSEEWMTQLMFPFVGICCEKLSDLVSRSSFYLPWKREQMPTNVFVK